MSDSDSAGRPEAPKPSLSLRIRDWVRGLRGKGADDSLREELEELLEEHGEEPGEPQSEERTLLRNVLTVADLSVNDIMVPRADIISIGQDVSLDEAVAQFIAAGHSRLPVHRGTLDDVAGMLHVKDLLPFWRKETEFALAPIVRKVLFVPPSVPVLDLLLQMRGTGLHMALVIDEYGGVDGLVTIEDLVEQIVGEIRDEYDEDEGPLLVEKPDGTLEAFARCPVETLEERIGYALRDPEREEDIDTLGGLVFSLVGRVPRRGELIAHPLGLRFEVLDADPRRVKRLRIRNLPPPPAPIGK